MLPASLERAIRPGLTSATPYDARHHDSHEHPERIG